MEEGKKKRGGGAEDNRNSVPCFQTMETRQGGASEENNIKRKMKNQTDNEEIRQKLKRVKQA